MLNNLSNLVNQPYNNIIIKEVLFFFKNFLKYKTLNKLKKLNNKWLI